MIRQILQLGDPLLWQSCQEVAEPLAPAISTLIQDLDDTLADFKRRHGFGRGIAAPQIGVLQRAIFIRMQPEGFCGALINPEVVWADEQQIELWDGCFSFPDLMVKVSRASRIRVRYRDRIGELKEIFATGDLSELLQHEIDHLDGILAVDRAVSSHAFATRKEWQRMQTVGAPGRDPA